MKTTRTALAAASLLVSAVLLLTLGTPSRAHSGRNTPENRACLVYIKQMFEADTSDKYDPAKSESSITDVSFYGLPQRNSAFFGNRRYVAVSISLYTTKTDHGVRSVESSISDMPQHYCILDDNNNVLGLEDDVK
jgi:hypothetical protein